MALQDILEITSSKKKIWGIRRAYCGNQTLFAAIYSFLA